MRFAQAVDEIFPITILMQTLAQFAELAPTATVIIHRGILSVSLRYA